MNFEKKLHNPRKYFFIDMGQWKVNGMAPGRFCRGGPGEGQCHGPLAFPYRSGQGWASKKNLPAFPKGNLLKWVSCNNPLARGQGWISGNGRLRVGSSGNDSLD